MPGSTRKGYVSFGHAPSRIRLDGLAMRCAVASSPGKRTLRWERGFAALSKFRAREGHCCAPRHHVEGGFNLGDWVSVQRYRKNLLPADRKQRLDAIEFVWDWRDYLWEQNFAALLKFKRREGHCCVPTNYRRSDLKLGWWVATQRRNKNEMSAERQERLNKIGFVWNVGFMGPMPIARVRRDIRGVAQLDKSKAG
jgi:Helicase associated domain